MRILLVLPAGDRVRVTRENPDIPKRAFLRFSVLPLTVVAALTPPQDHVAIVDENVEPLSFDTDADLIGISFMTALAPRACEIAREFRTRGKLVVAGGFHPTLCPEEAARHFDAIVVGDAEGAWERLVEDVRSGHLLPLYTGRRTSACPGTALQSPIPRRGLLERTAKHYVTINAVQTGRGCPHACRYCSVTAFHEQRFCQRPLAAVLADIQTVPRDLIFVDDNIIRSKQYASELFSALIPLKKRWVGQASIEIADDPQLLRLARASGCHGLFIGIESTDAQNLASVGKQFNESPRYRERLTAIRRAGISIIAGMIVGLDQDDPSVFERYLRLLQSLRLDGLQLNILTPLPGTPLFQEMQSAGRITDSDWSHYDFRHVVFRPRRMSAEDLQQGADWLYAQFYRLDRILLRTFRTMLACGWTAALLGLQLNLTYRYDNRRDRIRGYNPAGHQSAERR